MYRLIAPATSPITLPIRSLRRVSSIASLIACSPLREGWTGDPANGRLDQRATRGAVNIRRAREVEPAAGQCVPTARLATRRAFDRSLVVLKSRRIFLPVVACLAELPADRVKFAHVVGVELFEVRRVEGRRDVGQVEVDAVALRGGVDPVEVADALRSGQRGD